jgi:hypothetical protein
VIFSSILHGATLPAEGRQGGGRRDGLDWWPAKGPRRPPGPGPPRTLPARSSPWLSSAPAQDDVEGPATDSAQGLDPRARPRGDLDTFGGCACRDHCPDDRGVSLARMSQHGLSVPCHPRAGSRRSLSGLLALPRTRGCRPGPRVYELGRPSFLTTLLREVAALPGSIRIYCGPAAMPVQWRGAG